MDMMEIGNGNLTIEEERTHFAAWVFLKSPILLGTDVIATSETHNCWADDSYPILDEQTFHCAT